MAKKTDKTLADFMRDKKRATCPVCKLPEDIRSQLGKEATKRGFTRADQVEWLNMVVGAEITLRELSSHFSSRHEEGS